MSKRKLLISILLFLVYVALAWVGTLFLAPANLFYLVVFILIALGLTVLIVYLLMARMTAHAAGGRAADTAKTEDTATPSAPAVSAAHDPELKLFTTLIGEANTRLAQSPKLASRRVSTTVTGLPMLLLTGDGGAGKTGTFLNAGLEPELLAGQVYRDSEVLPTRIANLWYADDVLFVEPSGGIFSGEAGRWRGLLEKLRARSAAGFIRRIFGGKTDAQLRGVILFCDMSPFVGIPDSGRLGSLARRCQERLRQVGETFGINFPVYVVFTHVDGVPYFGEYFGHLVENEDQQILGCTLPAVAPNARPGGEVYSEAETSRLADAFNGLSFSLADKRMAMLPREHNAAAKPAIYEFPREMKRVRDTLVQFLVDTFRPNPLQPGPILRGFYFTGTRKVTVSALASAATAEPRARVSAGEATSLFNLADYQKRMGLIEQAAASPVETTATRWCFVSELFHRVVLHDPLSRTVAFANRRQDLYRRILWGGATLIGLILCFMFIRSWWGNRRLLEDVQQAADTPYVYRANAADPSLDNLRSMDALREQLATLLTYQREGPPMRLRWFLYSGGRVLPSLYDLYFQRFRQVFYDNFEGSIASTLIGLPSSPDSTHSYNAIYDRVKAYRMITQCKCSPDAAFLAPVLGEVWMTGRNLDQDRQTLALKQIDFYSSELKYKNPYRLDEKSDVVDRGRMYLSAFGGVERIYRGIVEEANKRDRPAKLAEIAPNYQQVLSTPGEVQAAFTREGWMFASEAIKDPSRLAMGEPCVVGTHNAAAQLMQGPETQAELQNMYISDYIRRWKDFTGATSVLPFRNAQDAAKKLSLLADNRSPLLAAVFLISDNTNFPPHPASVAKNSGLQNAITRMLPSRTNQAVNLAKSAMPTVAPPETTDDITKVFQPSREVVSPNNRDRLIDDPNRKYMDALADLQRDMDKLQNDNPSNPDMNLNQQAAQAVDAGLDSVRQIAQKFNIAGSQGVDTELQALLESPFRNAQRFIITDPTKAAREKANGALRSFCARLAPAQRKFPFNPQSDTDASMDEVASIFAPQSGAFAAFTQQVNKLVVKQGRLWVANPESPDAHPTEEFLRFLNHLQQIQDALYAEGGSQMKMHYTLRPLPGENVQAITLDIDGEKITASGQAQSKQFSWPGSGQVLVTVKAGGNIPFGSYPGPWAVWHWMYNADPRAPGSKTVQWSTLRQGHGQPQAVTDAEGKPIVMKVELGDLPAGVDVFVPSFFAVRCPGRAAD